MTGIGTLRNIAKDMFFQDVSTIPYTTIRSWLKRVGYGDVCYLQRGEIQDKWFCVALRTFVALAVALTICRSCVRCAKYHYVANVF